MFASLTMLEPLRGWNHSAEPLREAPPGAHPTPVSRADYGSAAVKAIQIEEFGGPEVLAGTSSVADPEAGEGEVVVEVARSGINFADTHATRNDYLAEQSLPLIPGAEVSGRTADGRRVAALLGGGGYAEKVVVPEAMLIPVPDEVDDDQAAALLLQGLTAMALVRRCARIEPGETLLVEAAAGGTGSLAVQLGKRAGAKVIGLASSEEKRALVERLGADATVDSRRRGPEGGDPRGQRRRAGRRGPPHERRRRLRRRALGAGAARPDGRLRHRLARAARRLHRRPAARLEVGDRLLARPPADAPGELVAPMIGELLGAVAAGELEVNVGEVYPLSEAARAHEDLIARRTTGKLLLDPSK